MTAIETGLTVTILNNVLIVLIFLTSILLTLTVLMHKGQGGGLSDMFGGGISSSAGSSGVAERNLNRITLGTLLVWLVCIIGYALLALRLSAGSHCLCVRIRVWPSRQGRRPHAMLHGG